MIIPGQPLIDCEKVLLCSAKASQTTSPQDYKTTSGCRLGLSYCFADYETTRLQVAAALLVVSLTSCLVVRRSLRCLNRPLCLKRMPR